MIGTRRFALFVDRLLEWHAKDRQETSAWEVWLHKIYGQTYESFKNRLGIKDHTAPAKEQQAETVGHSLEILDGFRPSGDSAGGVIQTAGDNRG